MCGDKLELPQKWRGSRVGEPFVMLTAFTPQDDTGKKTFNVFELDTEGVSVLDAWRYAGFCDSYMPSRPSFLKHLFAAISLPIVKSKLHFLLSSVTMPLHSNPLEITKSFKIQTKNCWHAICTIINRRNQSGRKERCSCM